MIICKLYGRLGNQMFQIAATISHAIDIGEKWKVPPHTIDSRIWQTYFDHLPKHPYPINLPTYNEHSFDYRKIPHVASICLNGYFQSEHYFKHNFKHVREAFFPNHKFGFHDFVSIHVRRGDYLQFKDKHPVLPLSYYNEAMNHFPEGTKFLVFSDDPEWCADNFNQDLCTIVEYGQPVDDMLLMADCKGHIIANSTFSWWGAYINREGKTIIAPDHTKWFGPGNRHLNTSTLIPESWTQIKF